MLKRFLVFSSLALAVITLGTGCSNKTKAERDSLANQNKSLADQLAAEKQARLDAENRANSLPSAPATTLPAEPSIPGPGDTSMNDEPAGPSGTVGSLTRGHNSTGEDTLTVSSDVLFDSGKATLKPAAKKALDKAASILAKEYSGRQIRVEGYTDPTPVKKAGWDDNWDLGAARARAVMLYLESKGVKHMYIASFGATNLKSTKNLAADRRVEIVVVRGAK